MCGKCHTLPANGASLGSYFCALFKLLKSTVILSTDWTMLTSSLSTLSMSTTAALFITPRSWGTFFILLQNCILSCLIFAYFTGNQSGKVNSLKKTTLRKVTYLDFYMSPVSPKFHIASTENS